MIDIFSSIFLLKIKDQQNKIQANFTSLKVNTKSKTKTEVGTFDENSVYSNFSTKGINLILKTVIWFVLYDLQWELKMINKLKKRAKRGQKNSIILHKTSNYSSQPPNHPITPMAATFYTYIYFVYILMIVTINIVMVFGVVW